jgi:hypothetical protein
VFLEKFVQPGTGELTIRREKILFASAGLD